MVQDPYKVLGIQQGASQDEIKRAYRQRAKENHPDLHPDDPNATQKMNEINEAYDMLMNPGKYQQRAAQEQARQQAQQQAQQQYQSYYGNPFGGAQQNRQGDWQQGGAGFGFEDFFNGFGFGGANQRGTADPYYQQGDSI